MLDRIEFLIHEALIALRRNGWMTFAAISTVAVSLFLLGGLGFAYLKTSEFAESIPGRFEMRVHLRAGTTQQDIGETAAKIRAIEGVKEASWIPRDKAWERMKEEDPKNTSGIEENPLPDAFKVVVSDLSKGDEIAETIKHMRTVSSHPKAVVYLKEEQQFVQDMLEAIRNLGSVLATLLTITAWILIYNAIRLTVQSRRLEIRIMQLVGSSRLTVQIPFLIEGILQGLVGGATAAFLLQLAYFAFGQMVGTIKAGPQMAPFPLTLALVVLGSMGMLYGLVCSMIAVRRPLKYR
jgi:cell division transport system permease protein